MSHKYKMLNIACGNRYHKDWINIDFHPVSKDVKRVNILQGLPFEDESIDFIYSSHFLEHLTPEQAVFVLRVCKRVLKSGGILRLVVPDLENICKEYLKVLEMVKANPEYDEIYEWIVIELLDQLVRTKPGGRMKEFFSYVISSQNIRLAEYIQLRIGEKLLQERKHVHRRITYDKMKSKLLYFYLKIIRLLIPKDIRDLVFVNTSIGEKHLWMYDEYSLSKKLAELGYRNISVKTYNESDIPNFNNYFLDINEDGTPYQRY